MAVIRTLFYFQLIYSTIYLFILFDYYSIHTSLYFITDILTYQHEEDPVTATLV